MRILFVHNYYRSDVPSGENAVVDAEIKMLQTRGHEVKVFKKCNDSIRKFFPFGVMYSLVSMIANPVATAQLRRTIRQFKPDVVHVHNLFPLISPLALLALGKTPCVMTLHNYRLFCAGETVCRDGGPCTLCLDKKSIWPSLRYRCYRNSLIATIPLAISISLYRALGFWRTRVSRFIALTEFQKRLVATAGIPEDRIVLKSNHVSASVEPIPWSARSDSVVFVGRVSREKGCDVLIRAWNKLGAAAPRLEIIGGGADLEDCKRLCENPQVVFRGRLPRDEVYELVGHSKLLLVPSLCFEGLPTNIVEAFMLGTPVLASNLGAMSTMIVPGKHGDLFAPGDVSDLISKFKKLWNSDQVTSMSDAVRAEYRSKYTEEENYKGQIEIYESVRKWI